jgi:hypothetical protein
METISQEELSKLTIVKLKNLAKEYEIKGTSNKNKDVLVNYIFHQINEKNKRKIDNNINSDVFEKINSENIQKDEINEIVDNFENNIRLHLYEHEKKLKNPKYYYCKYDYLNNNLSINFIESLLKKRLNFGDIIQFDDYRAIGCFIVTHDKLLQCSGYVSNDICIPLKISEEFDDPIELYKDIHNNFYGIELSKENKFIIDKFGEFDAPEEWKYYYVNQDIYENIIHIDIGLIDFIELRFDIENLNNNYYIYSNTIDYVKKVYNIHNSDFESYGIYVTLKNDDDENLSEEENEFIYNIEIPEYSVINIEFQCNYYEIKFTYLRKDKKNMINFINNYYFNIDKDFILEIEPVIDE